MNHFPNREKNNLGKDLFTSKREFRDDVFLWSESVNMVNAGTLKQAQFGVT